MGFLSVADIVIMGIGCVLLVGWLAIFVSSKKYNSLFEAIEEKEYPLKELYSMGYAVMEMIHYPYKSKFDRKLRSTLSILYEEKFVEFYLRVTYAQSISLAMLVLMFSFILYGLSREIAIFAICILMAGLCVYYFLTLAEKKIAQRSEELLSDFSEVVSKLALLTNAGMIMRDAWNEVAFTRDSTIYNEMQKAYVDMNNGVSEVEAIRRFGLRCIIPEIKKFSSTIIQGLEKGNSELAVMLQSQSNEVWGMKQQMVRRQGAKANTKLMLPMFIMFIGILIMIVIPIFANLGV